MPSRRGFLAAFLAAATVPTLSWADAGAPVCLGAAREPDGGFALFGLGAGGEERFRIPLPARGHAAAAHPTAPEAVAFARRPGAFALVIDCARGALVRRLEAPEGRHFYGHGAFIAGGDVLCTTENDIATGNGVIGLWSRRQGYARIGEIRSHGIGPHEILRAPGDVLIVANGGIRTDPAQGRAKLNLPTMRPNLAYLSADGALLDLVELAPELRRNSIRHIALGADGQVAFAMQWEGEVADAPPLVGLHRRGGPPRLLSAGLAEDIAMKGYASSVACDGAGGVAVTSSHGGRLLRFGPEGGFLGAHRHGDISGVAASGRGFLASDGFGAVMRLGPDGLAPVARYDRAWDNHLVSIAGA